MLEILPGISNLSYPSAFDNKDATQRVPKQNHANAGRIAWINAEPCGNTAKQEQLGASLMIHDSGTPCAQQCAQLRSRVLDARAAFSCGATPRLALTVRNIKSSWTPRMSLTTSCCRSPKRRRPSCWRSALRRPHRHAQRSHPGGPRRGPDACAHACCLDHRGCGRRRRQPRAQRSAPTSPGGTSSMAPRRCPGQRRCARLQRQVRLASAEHGPA